MNPTHDLIADLERMVATMQNMITALRGEPEPQPQTAQRWRAERGGLYWIWNDFVPCSRCYADGPDAECCVDERDERDDTYYNRGNYYQSIDDAEQYKGKPTDTQTNLTTQ